MSLTHICSTRVGFETQIIQNTVGFKTLPSRAMSVAKTIDFRLCQIPVRVCAKTANLVRKIHSATSHRRERLKEEAVSTLKSKVKLVRLQTKVSP